MSAANFVEETTTSIAGTNGDGAVTLSGQGNYPRFSSIWGTGRRDVEYTIEDTANGKIETGLGYVSSNVLTRSKVQFTWNGTTADDTSPSALQFGSSPASGDIRIRMAPLVTTFAPSVRGRQSVMAGDGNWASYPPSPHLILFATPTSANFAMTADREWYIPYRLDHGGVLTGAQFSVQTAASGKNVKWALYDIGDTFLAGAKITDFTTTSVGSTGFKTDTAFTPVYLAPGWYYIGMISDGTPNIHGVYGQYSSGTPLSFFGGYGWAGMFYRTGSYASGLANPATLTSPTLQWANSPYVGLKVDA